MFHPPLEIKAFCKNARIHTAARQAELLVEIQDLSWDVICFSETRAAAATTTLVGGHVLITHMGSTYGGVGILLNANFGATRSAHRNFGDRVLAVKLRIANAKLSIIAVYMPHAG